MSTPNSVNLNNLDGRYAKPADVTAAIASQAATDAGQYQLLTGPLGRWKSKLINDPTNAKLALVGDSTSDPVTSSSNIYRRWYGLHTQMGEAFYELGSSDKFLDGVANGSTTYTSSTAAFSSNDVGRLIHGDNIPLATTIATVNSSTSVTLTNSVPTGTGLTFWVGRHIIGGGNNGMLLSYWMNNPNFTSTNGRYNQTALLADNPNLIIASWLLNDVRQGGLGLTENAIVTAGTTLLNSFVQWVRTNLPNCDLLLRMPNTMLTADVNVNHFVTDGTNTNPTGLAQIYSTAIRRIYLSFIGKYPNVDVIDIQGELWGTVAQASHPYQYDQLHPSSALSSDVLARVPVGGGYVAIADYLAQRVGKTRNSFAPDRAQRSRHEFIVYSAPAAGQVRLLSRDYNFPASSAPVFPGDTIYINGFPGPITGLTAASIDRIESTNWLQINGQGSTDFSPYIGQTVIIAGSHPGATTGDRQQIYIDLPSIAAGATVTQSVSVTGTASGNNGDAAAVIASPGASFGSSSLLLMGCYPKSSGSVTLVINNPSGSAIDIIGESWTFWVVR